MRPDYNFDLLLSGVAVRLIIVDSGIASDEMLGDVRYRFRGEVARLLAPMRLVTFSADFSRSFEQVLGEAQVDEGLADAPFDPDDPEAVLDLGADGGIGAIALLLDRREPFEVEVDLDTSTDGPFWAFHDLSHAVDDCSGDWDEGLAEFPPPSAWSEDRANLEGARRALRAGVDLDNVLGALLRLREPFRERFPGDQSTALADLLDGDLPEAVRARPERVLDRVESTARDVLDYAQDDVTLDDLAREIGEGVRHDSPGSVLVALRDWDSLADCYGPGEVVELDHRAAYAYGGAVCESVRRLAQCEECEEERREPGSTTCADCAEGV